MTLQSSLNLMSVSLGFVAGVCFCVGAATNTSKQIANLAGSRVGYNLEIIQALSAQRAQYLVGAILLILAFGLQVAALMTPSNATEVFESAGNILLLTMLVASVLSYLAIRIIISKTVATAKATIEAAIARQREGRNT